MQLMIRTALLFSALTFAGAEEITPVAKVIQLLTDMKVKGQQMKQDEETAWASFNQNCIDETADSTGSKVQEIAAHELAMEGYQSTIESLETQIADYAAEIAEHKRKLEVDTKALNDATAEREKNNALNEDGIADLMESVDALERAITVLRAREADIPQTLLQLSTSKVLPEKAKRVVAAYLQMGSAANGDFAPEANAYEFQSGGIVDLLQKLKTDFIAKKDQAEREEQNMLHAYNMIKQDLTDRNQINTDQIADKTSFMSEKQERLAENKQALETETENHAADVAYLKAKKVECLEKGKSYQEKQACRDDEIAALTKAIEILSSTDVKGTAEKYGMHEFLQQKKALAQLRATAKNQEPDDARRSAADLLKRDGNRLHSQQLSMIAEKLSSGGPFDKIKQMIEDLVAKLEAEHAAEQEHKAFCDKELRLSKITRDKLTKTLSELAAKIDELTAFIADSGEKIAQLQQELSELASAMVAATTARKAEKEKNEETIEDAKEAQKATSNAVQVLKDFYKRAATATGFLQVQQHQEPVVGSSGKAFGIRGQVKFGSEEWNALADPNQEIGTLGLQGHLDTGHKEGMQTFGKTYKGMTPEAGGVLAILEVILSDFATLQAETEAAEAEALATYNDLKVQTKKDTAVKTKEVELLTKDKINAESELASTKKDQASTQDEMLAAERVYKTLYGRCIDPGVTYEERVALRAEEIQSLKDALDILHGTMAVPDLA